MKRKLVFATLCLLSFTCNANILDVGFLMGPAFSRLSNREFIWINDTIENQYHTHKHTEKNALLGARVGHSFESLWDQPFTLALAIAGYYHNFGTVKGVEFPFINNGIFDSLDYRFKAHSNLLFFEPRLIYTQYAWQPYFLMGIGEARNRLYSYHEHSSDPASSAATVPVVFPNNTDYQFAYEVGLGVQRRIFESEQQIWHWLIAVDYRYLNFGEAELKRMPAQTNNTHFRIAHLDTQAVMFTVQVEA